MAKAKALSTDSRALHKIKLLSDTTAGYKTREGLGKYWDEDLKDRVSDGKYSLTVDESTSESNQRVLNIMIHFWCTDVNQIVFQHVRSVELKSVDARSIASAILDTISSIGLIKENVVSIFSDSCHVMRGKKTGVWKRLNEKLPNIVDNGGDVAHTVHNGSVYLSSKTEKIVEEFLYNIHVDLLEVNQRQALDDIAAAFGLSIKTYQRRLSHR